MLFLNFSFTKFDVYWPNHTHTSGFGKSISYHLFLNNNAGYIDAVYSVVCCSKKAIHIKHISVDSPNVLTGLIEKK